jgi:hypothetical protein
VQALGANLRARLMERRPVHRKVNPVVVFYQLEQAKLARVSVVSSM